MPTLIVNQKGEVEPKVMRVSDDTITIGRQAENSVQLGSDGVSRSHAKIVSDGENFYLMDLRSGNGTFLNGLQLRPEEKNLLQAGDVIAIDEYEIRFQTGELPFDVKQPEEVTESDILEVKLLKKVLGALDKDTVPSIEVLNGTAEGKRFYFGDDTSEMVIGRDPECDFPINEYVISRKHARILRRWGGIAIRDLESKNGTFLNNRRVVEEYLHDGDRLALGTIVLLFRNPQEINLASFDEVRPKNPMPAILPQEIPGLEEAPPSDVEAGEAAEADGELPEVPEIEERQEGEESSQGTGSSAIEDWEKLEEEEKYPTPESRIEKIKTLTPVEIGMIGLGTLVLIFALITIVNLLKS